jgi:hypothetical protein
MSSTFETTAGRDDLSFISTLLRLFLFYQSRSALVYGVSGTISNRSLPVADANLCASFFVAPLAEK